MDPYSSPVVFINSKIILLYLSGTILCALCLVDFSSPCSKVQAGVVCSLIQFQGNTTKILLMSFFQSVLQLTSPCFSPFDSWP